MFTLHSPSEEKNFYIKNQKRKGPIALFRRAKYASQRSKRKVFRHRFFISLLILFSCFLPYFSDLDCLQNKKGFGLFGDLQWSVWYIGMAVLTLLGWGIAFVNSKKRKPYHFVLLAPIVMLSVETALSYFPHLMSIFRPFENKLLLDVLLLVVLFTITFFWLRNRTLKKNYFWHYATISILSALPYIKWLPYFRTITPIPPLTHFIAFIDVAAFFINAIAAWVFAFKTSGMKRYPFVILVPIIMLSFQFVMGFLLKLGSKKLFYLQTIDTGVVLSFVCLSLFVMAYFTQKKPLKNFDKKIDLYANRLNKTLYYSDDDHEDL